MSMDMSISGSGKIPAGEYGEIAISGSGSLYGSVRCASFRASGSAHGEALSCTGDVRVSGHADFSGRLDTVGLRVSGSFSCDEDVTASGQASCSGAIKCGKNLKCDRLAVSGSIKVGGDMEAEEIRVDGLVKCGGLLNAESVEIVVNRGMCIGSIGGSKVVIYRERVGRGGGIRLPLFRALSGGAGERMTVESSIEGDDIAVEGVTCPRVTGRVVAIGADCRIDLVQYSEQVEISPDATVGRVEKL